MGYLLCLFKCFHAVSSSHSPTLTAAGKEDHKYIGMNKEGATSIVSIEISPTIQESSAQHHGYHFPPGIPVGGEYKEKGKEKSEDEGTDEEL